MLQRYSSPEIKRGQVWFINTTNNNTGVVGPEGRPGIIVSSDYGNSVSPVVQICYMTMTPKNNSVSVKLWNTKKRCYTWAMCNQITTVSKMDLKDLMFAVTESELSDIDGALCNTLGLTISKPVDDISVYKAKIKELEENIEKQTQDCEIHKRGYDKLLTRLAEKQIEIDLLKMRTPIEKNAPVDVALEPIAEEPTPVLVDINRCAESELINLGFTFAVVRNITAGRPFLRVDDLRRIPGVTKMAFQIVEKKITVGDITEYLPKNKKTPKVVNKVCEPASERVNINTCTWAELKEVIGCGADKAYAITGYRKTHGPYSSVDDIINARGMTQKWIDRYRDKLEV